MTTTEQLEQLMFSKLNMIIKRNFYTEDEQALMKSMLIKDIKKYIELTEGTQ